MIDNIQHVYPINDIEPHSFVITNPIEGEPYCECACGCVNIIDNNILIIKHSSFDGREAFEIDNPIRLN